MSYLEFFISNPGLQHLARKIFLNLEHEDSVKLSDCRRVSNSLRDFIDKDASLIFDRINRFILERRSKLNSYIGSILKRRKRSFNGHEVGQLTLVAHVEARERQNDTCYKIILEKVQYSELPVIWKFMKQHYSKPENTTLGSMNKNFAFSTKGDNPLNILQVAVLKNEGEVLRIILDCSDPSFDYVTHLAHLDTLDTITEKGETLIYYACRFACDQTIKVLLTHPLTKSSVKNSTQMNGRNVLHYACAFDNSKLIGYFLDFSMEQNINLNTADKSGSCPIHTLCYGAEAKNIKLLLNHPVCKQAVHMIDSQTSEDGFTPLHLGCQRKNPDIVKAIINFATENGHLIKMNLPDTNGLTALHYACIYGSDDIIQLILDYHVTTNSLDMDYGKGKTALDVVVENDFHELAMKYVRKDVAVNF